MKKNQNELCYCFAFFSPKFLHFCRMTRIQPKYHKVYGNEHVCISYRYSKTGFESLRTEFQVTITADSFS